jgi:fission 1 protein
MAGAPVWELDLGAAVGRLLGRRGAAAAAPAERDGADLPFAPPETVAAARAEYEAAAALGGRAATEACFNLAWALAHSRERADAARGLELAGALAAAEGADVRELRYLAAVAQYRLGRALEARRTLKAALDAWPDFRQAAALLEAVEGELVRDGLVGVGAGAALLGAVAAVAIGAMRRR